MGSQWPQVILNGLKGVSRNLNGFLGTIRCRGTFYSLSQGVVLSNISLARLLWVSYINLQCILDNSNWFGIFWNNLQKFAKNCNFITKLSFLGNHLYRVLLVQWIRRPPATRVVQVRSRELAAEKAFLLSKMSNQSDRSMGLLGLWRHWWRLREQKRRRKVNDSAWSFRSFWWTLKGYQRPQGVFLDFNGFLTTSRDRRISINP